MLVSSYNKLVSYRGVIYLLKCWVFLTLTDFKKECQVKEEIFFLTHCTNIHFTLSISLSFISVETSEDYWKEGMQLTQVILYFCSALCRKGLNSIWATSRKLITQTVSDVYSSFLGNLTHKLINQLQFTNFVHMFYKCYWYTSCPLFSSISSFFVSFFPHLCMSFSEVSSTDTVFSSLSTPTKRSFESGMPQPCSTVPIIVLCTVLLSRPL